MLYWNAYQISINNIKNVAKLRRHSGATFCHVGPHCLVTACVYVSQLILDSKAKGHLTSTVTACITLGTANYNLCHFLKWVWSNWLIRLANYLIRKCLACKPISIYKRYISTRSRSGHVTGLQIISEVHSAATGHLRSTVTTGHSLCQFGHNVSLLYHFSRNHRLTQTNVNWCDEWGK